MVTYPSWHAAAIVFLSEHKGEVRTVPCRIHKSESRFESNNSIVIGRCLKRLAIKTNSGVQQKVSPGGRSWAIPAGIRRTLPSLDFFILLSLILPIPLGNPLLFYSFQAQHL